jgi:D-alanine-D-alanine ligase
MRVSVVYNQPADMANPDDADVLAQAAAVSAASRKRGYTVKSLPCTLDLESLVQALRRDPPDLVFNLAESLGGHARLIHAVPYLLESLGIPFTGSGADAVLVTSHKVLAKERMQAAGLPTPAWVGQDLPAMGETEVNAAAKENGGSPQAGWIVKSLWEHASVGLDEDETVLSDSPADARRQMGRHAARFGNACFAERYIDGREFNLALLAGPEGPRVLPPAEIVFAGYPPGKLQIVGYRAKWDPQSYEYTHTPRRFAFPPGDAALIDELETLALACWRVFGLSGYARVDFRVDHSGRPWILEVNANPCLSPDAGFAAALAEAGIAFDEAVEAILEDALR